MSSSRVLMETLGTEVGCSQQAVRRVGKEPCELVAKSYLKVGF